MNPNSGWFWLGCIPVRVAMAWFLPDQLLILIPLVLSVAMLVLWIINARQHATEGGGSTWWAPYRILHALILFCASVTAYIGNINLARCMLLLDVAFGSTIWIQQKKQAQVIQ